MFGFKKSPEKEAAKAAKLAAEQADLERERQAAAAALAVELANSKWSYQEHKDEMRGTSMVIAELQSDNMVEFEHPYGGGSFGVFGIRRHSDGAQDAYFRITKGQLISELPSTIYLFWGKFDDRYLERWFGKAVQSRYDIIFLDQAPQFIRDSNRFQKFTCEVKFYKSGSRQFVFSLSGRQFPAAIVSENSRFES